MNLGQIAETNRLSRSVHTERKHNVSKKNNDSDMLLNLQDIVRRLRKEYITRATGNEWRKMIYTEIKKKNGITWAKLGTNRRELKKLIEEALLYRRF